MKIPSKSESGKEVRAEQIEQKTRIVVMLGARLFQQGEGNDHPPRFPLINESAKEGMAMEVSGGDSRMRAIQQLYKEFSDKKETENSEENLYIFTTGGEEKIKLSETGDELILSRAKEAKKKLVLKYGIPDNFLEEALASKGSTLGNAAALSEWIKNHHDVISDIHDIEIVTNEFHITRAWIMFSMAFYKNELGEDMEIFSEDIKKIESILDETLVDQKNGDHIELAEIQKIFEKYLRNVSIQVKPLIVEDILLRKGVSGEEYVRKIKSDKLVEQARANERTGIKDLIHGHYRVK